MSLTLAALEDVDPHRPPSAWLRLACSCLESGEILVADFPVGLWVDYRAGERGCERGRRGQAGEQPETRRTPCRAPRTVTCGQHTALREG